MLTNPNFFKSIKSHIFSIYDPKIKFEFEHVSIVDKTIVQRLSKVLRISPKDDLIVFNNEQYCFLSTEKIYSKEILFQKKSKIFSIEKPKPEINFYVSLLKKDSMESICNSCSMIGINNIIPIITNKVQRKFGNEKEMERLKKILISGCEQSKNFNIPILKDPLNFDKFLKLNEMNDTKNFKIFFDINGNLKIGEMIETLKSKNDISTIDVFIGPEGDLTDLEYESLKNFNKMKLSENILTSTHATILGLGLIRGIF
eukprot:gene8931-880_t